MHDWIAMSFSALFWIAMLGGVLYVAVRLALGHARRR